LLLQACLNKAPKTEIRRLAELAENQLLPKPDPEDKYYQGAILAACGEPQIAYVFLMKGRCRELLCVPSLAKRPVACEPPWNS
jgi:hypothetical protein